MNNKEDDKDGGDVDEELAGEEENNKTKIRSYLHRKLQPTICSVATEPSRLGRYRIPD